MSSVTSATSNDGAVIDMADFDLDIDSGLLHSATLRYTRNVVLTVTVGSLPANHREAIIADVAGYFAATQRGNGAGARPDTGYDSAYVDRSTPVVLFPRIRALAAAYPAIA